MIRKIIQIDKEKCNGCGLCIEACHEQAIGLIDGKATLLRDDYCDGLGDCLPTCPTNAISFIEREAAEYDEEAVKRNQAKSQKKPMAGGCPGSRAMAIQHEAQQSNTEQTPSISMLQQWPVQIQLVPVHAPYFDGANLLIAADCSAYAYGNFHREFMNNHITLIGCPKLDVVDYREKLTEIIRMNNIQSVTVVRMEVPCCSGLEQATKTAVLQSGKNLACNVVVISTDGKVLS